MKYTYLRCALTLLIGCAITMVQSQASVHSSGGDATGSGGTVSFSIGQVAYQAYNGASSSIAEGVQQPYEIFAVTDIDAPADLGIQVLTYPNPVADYLQVRIKTGSYRDVNLLVYDLEGRLLIRETAVGDLYLVDMSGLPASAYLLRVMEGNRELESFKIIKK